MTTTDPTPLAEQIAREHAPRFAADGLGCSCQPRGHLPWGVSGYVQHVTTVTERAVRERVADESMLREIYRAALRRLGTDPDEIDAAFREGLSAPVEELGAPVSPAYLTNGAPDA